jgi:opacity protein-like surface antigen
MLKSIMSRSIAAALLLTTSGAAFSADLDNVVYAPQLPRTVPVEVGNGWYLRGDVSYDFSTDGGGSSFRTFNTTTLAYGTQNYSSSNISTDWGVGGAVGYQLTDWFRAEAAADYYTGSFNNTSGTSTPCTSGGGGPTNTGCTTTGTADFDAYSVMANGYVDLGTYVGFTPYIGAGAGMTLVDYDNYTSQDFCVDGTASCGTTTFSSLTHAGQSDWRFTYALMAGLAYSFSRNLKADIGYRYFNVAGGDAYAFDSTSIAAGATGVQGTDNGYSAHQVRASIRYALW